ncbi:MAG: acyltransferase domain-containing protein [Desulfovibrio sp.]|nr:acyltransferase domain-containing protein [Desulfovibrio sp.]
MSAGHPIHPGTPASEADVSTDTLADELALDGVRYARLHHAGQPWLAGSLDPLWRQGLLALGTAPGQEELAALGQRGLWLAPASQSTPKGESVPLAAMCCGLGSVWPGMGRELYDNFPAARAAMDELAALADWDLLGLMDEQDTGKIGLTRWQIPYLFLLEYAQWSQLRSLGLKPGLLCGHSLGELIALCFAGIYSPAVAWYILDTRAVHMAELEAQASRDTGMMAVHADAEVIAKARETWPALYISNYNTPKQHILSGPCEVLQEARKSLRKQRIPAMLLNMSLAFHHPSMRILRDMSLRRLNALEMHAPHTPLLSGITVAPYPDDQPSICRHIADLDENSVRWVEAVEAMQGTYGIRHFLEIGPQETLCGLVQDISPEAVCLHAGRKGHETLAMREVCARLYALGHLPHTAIQARCTARQNAADTNTEGTTVRPIVPAARQSASGPTGAQVPEAFMQTVLELLAEASGIPATQLHPQQDLRYDLALRSNRFPLLVQEAESRLGIQADFESLLHVSTIMDLAVALLRCSSAKQPEQRGNDQPTQPEIRGETQADMALAANLAREVFSGQEYLLFRRPAMPEGGVQPPSDHGSAFLPPSFPLTFADPEPPLPPAPNLFQGCCHFSRFAEPRLQQHGTPPHLPTSDVLRALLQGATALLPGLTVHGFCDVRITAPLPLPAGVTRECRLRAQARLWLKQDKAPSRMCYTWLSARDLAPNGRRTGRYSPLAEGMALLTRQPPALPPIWQELPPLPCAPTGPEQQDNNKELKGFYRTLALGEPWHLLQGWQSLPPGLLQDTAKNSPVQGLVALLPPPGTPKAVVPSVAPGVLWRYTAFLTMVESVIQSAQLALWHERCAAGADSPTVSDATAPMRDAPHWQLGAIGFIRFAPEPGLPHAVILRPSWADSRLRRFEAQVCDAQGLPLLTVHHLEFRRHSPALSSLPQPLARP